MMNFDDAYAEIVGGCDEGDVSALYAALGIDGEFADGAQKLAVALILEYGGKAHAGSEARMALKAAASNVLVYGRVARGTPELAMATEKMRHMI